MKIFTRYLDSAASFAPPDDAAARQAERDSINVESMEPNEEIEGNEPAIEEVEEEGNEDKEEEVVEEAKKEETDEEKEARIVEAKEQRKADRQQKRIDKAVSAEKEARTELEILRRQIAENPKDGLSEEEVERRAEIKANEKLAAKQRETESAEFDRSIERLATQGNKSDKDFDKKIDDMAKEVGAIPMNMIEALAELDNENGGDVLAYLANNVDEYQDFFDKDDRPISERKMVQKLIRISDKVKESKRAPVKVKSKVPAPVSDIEESSRPVLATITGKEDMETYSRIREKQVEARRKAQGY
jgi:hypothetical protein